MDLRLVTVLVCALVQVCHSETPEFEIKTDCLFGDNLVEVVYYGEAVAVYAVNSEAEEFEFEENLGEGVSWTLLLKLEKDSETDPSFDKTPDLEVYQILIQGRQTIKYVPSEGDVVAMIQCSYMTYAEEIEGGSELTDQIQSPEIIVNNTGSVAESNFTVSIVKINERPFTNKIRMGRIVKLKATMTGTVNETKFHVTNCNAYSTDLNATSVVLIDGCGTGHPFTKKQGFTLRGLSAISPSFQMFRIKRAQGILFKCSFVICNDECPENSCQVSSERRKREADGELEFSLEDKQLANENRRHIDSHTNKYRNSQSVIEVPKTQPRLHTGKIDVDKLLPVLLDDISRSSVEDVKLIRGGLIINIPSKNGKFKGDNSYVGTSNDIQVVGDEDFGIPLGEMSKINRVIESVSTRTVTLSDPPGNSEHPNGANDVIIGIPTESKTKSNTPSNMNKEGLFPKNRITSTETRTVDQATNDINSKQSIASSDQKEASETKILLSANDTNNENPADPLVHKTSRLNVFDIDQNSEKSKSTEMKRRLKNLNSSIQISPTAHGLSISVIISLLVIFA
ncbi:Hypothetical predicted protein [Mytilus galloprovincialis]|uniref:ZP domain-containing protein n=1 Tax=Mytilus galloprovincialis TaxID=29158 RepID=A0A8B6FDI6_MYTGA|nr:Hypothetical predicted protein [Mytilus galloprovincialis]